VKKKILLVIVVSFFVHGAIWLVGRTTNNPSASIIAPSPPPPTNQPSNIISDTKTNVIGCNRTTRLENEHRYDRALSLIEEKYIIWEEMRDEGLRFGYFFPSQLVNCIKIIEGDIRNSEGLEGYFVFNSPEIKEDYFPITVDRDYISSDTAVTALLLVHEIFHVQQYINSINSNTELSCLDKEAESFYAQFVFYAFQYREDRKSMDLRIDYDENLHPQLKIIDQIKNNLSLEGLSNTCRYNPAKNDDHGYCVDNYRKNEIKELLLQDEYYQYQCST
jgi:hypothetical protein